MPVDRRELIQILGVGLSATSAGVAQHQHGVADARKKPAAAYVPRALTEAEYATVDKLTEILLPTDEMSAGAHQAGVARYVDIVLLYGPRDTLAAWQSGIRAVDSAATTRYERPFDQLAADEQTAIMQVMAKNESNPATELEQFFLVLKRLAMEAYYHSAPGKQSLGYKGDTAVASFPGCTHAAHKS